MSNEADKTKNIIRIELNPAQQERVREETGKQADAIELSMNELEERIAPRAFHDF